VADAGFIAWLLQIAAWGVACWYVDRLIRNARRRMEAISQGLTDITAELHHIGRRLDEIAQRLSRGADL